MPPLGCPSASVRPSPQGSLVTSRVVGEAYRESVETAVELHKRRAALQPRPHTKLISRCRHLFHARAVSRPGTHRLEERRKPLRVQVHEGRPRVYGGGRRGGVGGGLGEGGVRRGGREGVGWGRGGGDRERGGGDICYL